MAPRFLARSRNVSVQRDSRAVHSVVDHLDLAPIHVIPMRGGGLKWPRPGSFDESFPGPTGRPRDAYSSKRAEPG